VTPPVQWSLRPGATRFELQVTSRGGATSCSYVQRSRTQLLAQATQNIYNEAESQHTMLDKLVSAWGWELVLARVSYL